jgi:hypothetical protein
MALIWVKKPGKKVGFSEKPWNIINLEPTLILFALSSDHYWIFRRGAQTGDHFISMALTIYLIFSDMKRWRKFFEGRGSGLLPKIPRSFPQETFAGVSS